MLDAALDELKALIEKELWRVEERLSKEARRWVEKKMPKSLSGSSAKIF